MESDMADMKNNELFNLLLADIAMAAAIPAAGSAFVAPEKYQPGTIRDSWLADNGDDVLRRRVLALANAGMASLQGVDGEQLTRAAGKYGVPIDGALGEKISQFFTDKREAVLRYRS
jgi:hypothetical protein